MKKVLSLILALAMLLVCSLTAFALEMKEPCEEPGCTGEIVPSLEYENIEGYGVYDNHCPVCGHEPFWVEVYYDKYTCNACDTYAYRIFRYYKSYCGCYDCMDENENPAVTVYYNIDQYHWEP